MIKAMFETTLDPKLRLQKKPTPY